MQSALVAILALFVTTTALQAQLLPNAQRPKPRPPQLMASENGQNPSPLSLAKADIRTVITGYLAETTMTLTFYNDGARVLEGELSFPLPENATISGYALDVNGVLVDGVPVERQKARITYEKETRKRVDPGLVEQTVGNNFTTRVYPIPAHGSRTIKVQYVADVTDSDKGAVYRLPMNWGQVVKEGSIRVEVVKSASEPVAKSGGAVKLGFTRWEGRFVAEEKLENTKLDDELVIELPDAARAPVLVEKRVKQPTVEELLGGAAAPAGHSDYYFVINDKPAIPEVADGAVRNATRVGILWDASLSRAETDKSRELALLKKLLAHVDPHGGVDIVAFRNEPDAPVSFPMSGGIDPILHHLESLVYDGGTNLSKLSISRLPSPVAGANVRIDPAAYDYWLMFTDGLADLGPEMPAKIEARVYPISNDPHSNHALLRRLAAASGGVYFNLERATDEQVMAGLAQSPYALIGVDCNPAEVADIYPHGSQPVLGRVTVTGRLLVPEAKVTLKYGFGGSVLKTQQVTLTQQGAAETGLVPRYWAQQKVAELSSDVEGNGAALAAVGKEFNLVTANTSLLVLETVEQYLQYRIVPPKTQPELYARFMGQIEQQKTQQAQTHEERIAAVLNLWNQRVNWWNGQYKYAKDFKYKEPDGKGEHFVGVGRPAPAARAGDVVIDAAASAASAAPAPVPAASTPAPAGALEPMAPTGVPHPGLGGDRNRDASQDKSPDRLDPATPGVAITDHGTFALASDASKKSSIDESVGGPSIAIKAWDPKVPYLVAMREAGGDGAYAVYLKQRKNFIASPAFYLDCADYLLRNGQKAMGVRVLTNIAELKLENAQLLADRGT